MVQRRFRIMYHTEPPTDKTIHEWYVKFQQSGCLCAVRAHRLRLSSVCEKRLSGAPHVTKGAHIEQLQGWTKIWRDSLSIHMLLSAVSVLVVAQSIFEIPEGLMNNPVYIMHVDLPSYHIYLDITLYHNACFLQPTSWCWTFAARNMWTSFCKIKIIRITTVHQIGFKCHS